MEEKYDILLENYLELEKEVVGVLINHKVRVEKAYQQGFDIITKSNRRLVNLLSAAKLYADTLEGHMAACRPDDPEARKIAKSFLSEEYDSVFEYRFMCALRNYIQHEGLAVHRYQIGGTVQVLENNNVRESILGIFSSKEKLDSSDFKRKVWSEMPDKVDLLHAARRFMSCINNIHIKSRELASANIDGARGSISSAIERYKEAGGSGIAISAFMAENEESRYSPQEEELLLLQWDDMRVELSRRNRRTGDLASKFLAGDPKD